MLSNLAFLHNPWRARFSAAGSTTFTVATFVIVAFDTVQYDPVGMLTTGAGAKATIPVSGDYLVSVIMNSGATVSDRFIGSFYINGIETNRMFDLGVAGSGGLFSTSATIVLQLNASDYIDFRLQSVTRQNSGGNQSFSINLLALT